jgi:hypothetical protein
MLLSIVSVGEFEKNEVLWLKKKLSFNNNNECAHTKAGNLIVLLYSLQVKECDMNSIDQRNKSLSGAGISVVQN